MPNVKQPMSEPSASKPAALSRRRANLFWHNKLTLMIGSGVLIFAALLHLQILPLAGTFERLERANLDLCFRLRGPQTPDSRIHLVTIDDLSLQKVGGWPWPREKLAQLLARLLAGNPKLVVCDLLLPHKPEEVAGTQALTDAVSPSGKVMFPYYFSDFGKRADPSTLPDAVATSAYLLFDFPEELANHPPVEAGAVFHSSNALLAVSLPGGTSIFRKSSLANPLSDGRRR
jgi:CHASE2 domain-containing sensor protein